MEHRWGARRAVDIPIRLTARPFALGAGRLTDVSLSGGFILVDCELRVLSSIQVAIETPRSRRSTSMVAGYVTRKREDGIGVEWCEFAPQAIVGLLREASARRGARPSPAAPAAPASSPSG